MEDTTTTVASGNEQASGGALAESQGQKNQSNESPAAEQKAKTVDYASYQKAVDEAKKAKAKAAEYERAHKAREEDELKKQGDYQKLLGQRDAELAQERQARQAIESKISESRKLNAILGAVTGEVPKQYWGLLPIDEIAVDPETGLPDEASVKKIASDFEKSHPEVVKRAQKGRLPNDAPKGAASGTGFEADLKRARTQKDFDAVLAKYGKL